MTSISDIASNVFNDYYSTISTTNSTSTTEVSSTSSTTATPTTTTEKASYTNKTAVGRYIKSEPADNVDAKTLFKNLSVDVGGDGKTITKDQLDSYVKKAESGKIKLPDEEVGALKELQKNWDNISTNGDSISYADVSSSGGKDTLMSMVPTGEDKPDYMGIAKDATTKAYDKIVNAALNGSSNEETTSGLKSLLNELLSGTTDENDDTNANMIDTLTNLISGYNYSVEYKA